MERSTATSAVISVPAPRDVLRLMKPVTWFPPMWAFMCGVVSSGAPLADRWLAAVAGILLAGPLICATSQAANDWYDRHVDAINEPDRPIPSGRIPGRWGLWIALIWTAVSLAVAQALGPWVFVAAVVGMALAWAYSAPPFRFKQNGWLGAAASALAYEGITWFTGATVMTEALPSGEILSLAALYSLGAHGIMTLNDFKAIEGDRRMGIRSLPVQLGVKAAARLSCAIMALPQAGVVALLLLWQRPWHAGIVAILLLAQLGLMARLLRDPARLAPWYNATGTTLYAFGMLASALAVSHLGGGHP